MSKVGQQITDFRKTTPRHIQWILLGAALVVVAVLAVLLISSKRNANVIAPNVLMDEMPELRFVPNAQIDWLDTNVGDTRTTMVQVFATNPVQINDVVVRVEGETAEAQDLSATATCTNDETVVTADTPCIITLQYAPTHVTPRTNVDVALTWTAVSNAHEDTTPNAITAIISARDIERPRPTPILEPEPEPEPEPYEAYNDFQDDLDDIAPTISFTEPEPVVAKAPKRKFISAGCSEFSFPGYNTAGVQSGWIKPKGGAYYYHPFADENCENPTGIYNADTGYIMDISNPTRKIGSDAEHVRFVVQDRLPQLSGGTPRKGGSRATQLSDDDLFVPFNYLSDTVGGNFSDGTKSYRVNLKPRPKSNEFSGYKGDGQTVYSTLPYDRTFVLRQYKPIPATIVSDIQADKTLLQGGLPVRATVDRNVYSDNGRTVIIPTGTLLLGRVVGDLPGPYKAVGRMEIEWYQFIRPDGVEFSFTGNNPFSADSQGRKGVPGHGSTDYLQQFVMPMLTAIVPAAVNLIAPISDAFVNQIDLDNNTVVQSGTVRSSELAKNEIITAWNNVATKLLVDVMDNTTPPFSIAAGTRITVFSPVDLVVTCGDPDTDPRKCAIYKPSDPTRGNVGRTVSDENRSMEELIGQVRSLMQSSIQDQCCNCDRENAVCTPLTDGKGNPSCDQYSFATIDFYCRSFGTYDAINNAKQQAVFENQKQTGIQKNTEEYNTQVLGLKYNEDGSIQNPFKKETPAAAAPAENLNVITCDNGANPDANGCCPGETYTDMGDQGFNCCPDIGGDCFPPIEF